MKQVPHENPDVWPTPLGIGLLAELDFQEKDTNLEVPGGSLFNLTSSTVRAASPGLPDELVDMFLPGGQGSLGTKIIAPESSYDYLDDELYEVIGLETPDQDNGYGELVFINDIRRIIATIPDEITDDMNLPFKPLGTRVFLEFDYDDQSVDVVDPETGETFSRADDDGEPDSDIVVPESSYARQNRLATVIDTGPDVENIEPGARVIPPEVCDSIQYQDEDYFFVRGEGELVAVL
jgi:hypothetical protein